MNDVIVGVISTVLLSAVATGAYAVRQWVQAHFKPQQLGALYDLARTAVAAAQQFGVAQNLSGSDKLDYATKVVVDGAKHVGLKVTEDEVSSFIHAALREMKQVQVLALPPSA